MSSLGPFLLVASASPHVFLKRLVLPCVGAVLPFERARGVSGMATPKLPDLRRPWLPRQDVCKRISGQEGCLPDRPATRGGGFRHNTHHFDTPAARENVHVDPRIMEGLGASSHTTGGALR